MVLEYTDNSRYNWLKKEVITMTTQDNRNFKIAILLNIISVLTTCSLYLAYKLFIQHEINFCQEQEYRDLLRKHKDLEQELKSQSDKAEQIETLEN